MFEVPSLKPRWVKSQGNFRVAAVSGALTTAGAASDIVSFRWGSTTLDCVVWWVSWVFYVTTGFTAGQVVDHAMYFARKFTASPSGGTDYVPAAGMGKKRTNHSHSALTAFQMATTGALTAGTRTLDTYPMAYRGLWAATATAGAYLLDIGNQIDPDSGAFYLQQDEGFVVQNVTLMGAAGVIKFACTVAWSEIAKDSLFIPDNIAP